jgi:hypothetical protein
VFARPRVLSLRRLFLRVLCVVMAKLSRHDGHGSADKMAGMWSRGLSFDNFGELDRVRSDRMKDAQTCKQLANIFLSYQSLLVQTGFSWGSVEEG